MRVTWSDLFEVVGLVLLLVAAGLWDGRALLALVGAGLVLVGYVAADGGPE